MAVAGNERRVALVTGTEAGYRGQVTLGVTRYVREHARWRIAFYDGMTQAVAELRDWRPEGVIAYAVGDTVAALAAVRLPVVNVSGGPGESPLPQVVPDDEAMGRLAAEHFLDRGFERFGYVGVLNHHGAAVRLRGFEAALRERGHACASVFASPSQQGRSYARYLNTLQAFIDALEPPVGVFCFSDGIARIVLEACGRAGLRIPEQVAILGCDDNPIVCQMAWPPLSSIRTPAEEVGYEAGRLLDRLMDGEPVPTTLPRPKPGGITVRQSTDVLAIEDQHIREALRIIRSEACQGINVEAVLQRVPISRTHLEVRFRQILGRTPLQEIRRVRIDRACELLTQTLERMPWIAGRCGFSSQIRFSTVFRQVTGMTPTAYRRQAGRATLSGHE